MARVPRRWILEDDGRAPRKHPGQRRLTILLRIMIGVTVVTGLLAAFDWLNFSLSYIDSDASLAQVREFQEGTSLFWPALLVTGILWLWKTLITRSRVVVRLLSLALAFFLTGIAVYGLVMLGFPGYAETRDPFVVRFWECPAGIPFREIEKQVSTCTEHPIDQMDWFIIEEDDYYNVASPTFRQPSSQAGNTATWEGLPQGEYVAILATEADLSSYDMAHIVRVTNTSSWEDTKNLRSYNAGDQPYWTERIEFTPQLQSMDVYFLPLVKLPVLLDPESRVYSTPAIDGCLFLAIA